MNQKYLLISTIFLLCLGSVSAQAEETQIPNWIKNNAKWWSENTIGDSEFISGIQYLVEKEIIKIPTTTSSENRVKEIPTWIKNNAGWWASGKVTDSDFVSGLQYLIKFGIINVSKSSVISTISETYDTSKCDNITSAADKRTCIKEIQEAQKIQSDLAKAVPNEIGPITFYYVDNKIEKTGQGTILTINFLVKNTGAKGDVDIFCTGPVACNYALYDGKNEIVYTQNTLTSGHLLLKPNAIKPMQWVFYHNLFYDVDKDYYLKVKEPWGTGQIPLNLD